MWRALPAQIKNHIIIVLKCEKYHTFICICVHSHHTFMKNSVHLTDFVRGSDLINLPGFCMLYGLFVVASMVFSQRPVSLSSASLQPLVRLQLLEISAEVSALLLSDHAK